MHSCCSEGRMCVWSLCLIFFSLSYTILVIASPSSPVSHLCLPDQKDALLEFKNEFYVQGASFFKKKESDCCSWDGVYCDPKTGKVVELDLYGSSLNGPLRSNSSLFKLLHLESLNLGNNNIFGILPDSIGNFTYLKFLYLYECKFFGKIPSSLGNLSQLTHLDLSDNDFTGEVPDSLANLNRLTWLDLSSTKLGGNFPSLLLNLSSLTEIHLSYGQFSGMLPSNMSSLSKLETFDIRGNLFSGSIPSSLFMIPSLIELLLDGNAFTGPLEIGNISSSTKLEWLYLGENNFKGPIPESISKLVGLEYLDLSNWNTEKRMVDFSIFSHLTSITTLYLSHLNTRSMVDLSLFSNLRSLEVLDLSGNNLKINSAHHLPGSITALYLSSCNIVEFPKFLQNKTSLSYLDISANKIEGQVPEWLWSLPSLQYVSISQNFFTGFEGSDDVSSTLHLPLSIEYLVLSSCNIVEFPKFLQTNTNLSYLDISANKIEGQVPEWLWSLPKLRSVNISQNFFTGFEGSAFQRSSIALLDISSNAFKDPFPLLPNSMLYFLGSDNQFSGEIPQTICELRDLGALVLSNNNFSGSIPHCFKNFNSTLRVLHLRNNSLYGVFPEESITDQLISLDVGLNQLSGKLPKSLINCTHLEFLNVEGNRFKDEFPFWLRLLPNLQILVLRSNEFHGPISSPGDNCLSFPMLRMFDISRNCFSGVLSSDYFAGWSAMSSVVDIVDQTLTLRQKLHKSLTAYYVDYHKSVGLANKGSYMELIGSGFTIYKTIDISGNRFQGNIPESIGLLKELIVLNMSNNAFTGHIPPSLDNLTNLQSLDLSQNRLSGKIPPELAKLTFLEVMNFSYNKLEGPIPQGTQIQSQDSSSFQGNLRLCGAPLQETCGGGHPTTQHQDADADDEEEDDQVISWIAAAISYVPGIVCGLTIGYILDSYKPDWFMRIFHSRPQI